MNIGIIPSLFFFLSLPLIILLLIVKQESQLIQHVHISLILLLFFLNYGCLRLLIF